MSGDFLSDLLKKFNAPEDHKDVILNLLIKFIHTTDNTLSEETKRAYTTLQLLINGQTNSPDIDPHAVELIREAYEELLQEMSSVEFDEQSIRAMVTPESFDDGQK